MLRKLLSLEILRGFIYSLLNDSLNAQAAIRVFFTELEAEIADLSLCSFLQFLPLYNVLCFLSGRIRLFVHHKVVQLRPFVILTLEL